MAAITICSDFGAPQNKVCYCFHCFSIYLLWTDGARCHVWMWELDCEESWAPKNWCFWTVVLEKTLESPLDCKEIQPVHPKGDQSWMFIGRTDVEAETPIFWPPDAKSWLIWKDPDAWKDWGQEEKGMTEDEMVRWHHWLNGYGLWWTPGVGDGQGGLACCGSWDRRVRHDWATELNWSEPQSTSSLVFADCIELLHLGLKEYNQCDFRWPSVHVHV